MKPHHLLTILLILATLSVDASVVSANQNGTTSEMILALAMAQTGLLAAWLVWGRWNLAIRLTAWIAAVMLWAAPLSQWNQRPASQWMTALAFYSLLVMAPMLWMRIKGYRITSPAIDPRQRPVLRPWQFSLGNLMCCMTVSALLLGLGRLLQIPWALAGELTLFCGVFSLVTVVALLGALCSRNAISPMVAVAMACLLAALLLSPLTGSNHLLIAGAIDATFVALSVTVVRVGEFRLEAAAMTPTH